MSGQLPKAEALYRDVLGQTPDHADALFHLGMVLHQTGRHEPAVDALRHAITVNGNVASYHSVLGSVLQTLGRAEEALASHRRAVELMPEAPQAHNNLAITLKALGRIDQAVESFRRTISLSPNIPEAHNNLGLALGELGRYAEAITSYRAATDLKPDFAEAHNGLGLALKENQQTDEAILSFRQTIALRPDDADAYNNLGLALQDAGRFDEAIVCYRKAAGLGPDSAVAYNNLGLVLWQLGFYAQAEENCRRAIALKPDLASAHNNLGIALRDQGHAREALDCFHKAIALQPEAAELYSNLARSLEEDGRIDEAIAAYEKAMAFSPTESPIRNQRIIRPEASIQLAYLRRVCGDWSTFDADDKYIRDVVKGSEGRVASFQFLLSTAPLAEQLECARAEFAGLSVSIAPKFRHDRRPRAQRLRIGYLSADFRNHAVASLIAELLERHDRTRYEIFGYSTGRDDGTPIRKRIEAGVDQFIDAHSLAPSQLADRMYGDTIDILIDLTGLTTGTYSQVAAYRPAPIQVNYLGFPGTIGADCIDYIVGDPTVTPIEDQAFYGEKIVQLPDCYQPNDTERTIANTTPSRREHGLPEHGFVFCCFSTTPKITPAFFDIWMRLLKTVPGSVLWLLENNDATVRNLRREAQARGVDPGRLIFASRISSAEHLARHRHADLFLDTLPYNAHTTASDALWAGLPVVTCMGPTFAGRVGASLLQAIDLPELITDSLAAYEALALDLARNPDRLAALKAKLASHRLTTPLFDIGRFTRHLEAAYDRMWDIWSAGKPPEPFAVASIAARS
ncbi:MAG TPA: tetratricopeptide repeat protein [Magnetospirillaceae bacterium]|jgi:predicted O-linked N-acetylglucosamine transferase (SPINDLY family)